MLVLHLFIVIRAIWCDRDFDGISRGPISMNVFPRCTDTKLNSKTTAITSN
jgi:hypothetical protein